MNWCAIVAGLLGSVGGLGFIALYTFLPDIRNMARRLFLSLVLAETIQAVLTLVQGLADPGEELWCWATGPLLTAATMSSALWTACISVYVSLVINRQITLPRKMHVRFRVISWGYPVVWVMLVIGHHYYHYRQWGYASVNTGQCFESLTFDPSDKPFFWLGYTAPLAACLWLTSYNYLQARLQIRLKYEASYPECAQYAELAIKYALIPTLFVMLRSWVYVEALVAVYDPSWLPMCSCLRVFGVASQGCVDTVVFVLLTDKLRSRIFNVAEEEDSYATISERSISNVSMVSSTR